MSSLLVVFSAVRNEEAALQRMFSHLAAQDLRDFEVCISDNCSSDKSAEIIKQNMGNFRRFHFISQSSPLSAPDSWSAAVDFVQKKTKAKYIFPIAGDDYIEGESFFSQACNRIHSYDLDFAFPIYENPRWKNPDRMSRQLSSISEKSWLNRLRIPWSHSYGHLLYSVFLSSAYYEMWDFLRSISDDPEIRDWWAIYFILGKKGSGITQAVYVHTDEKSATSEGYFSGEYFWPEGSRRALNPNSGISPRNFYIRLFNSYICGAYRRFPFSIFIIIWVCFFRILRKPLIELLWYIRKVRAPKFD